MINTKYYEGQIIQGVNFGTFKIIGERRINGTFVYKARQIHNITHITIKTTPIYLQSNMIRRRIK